jgi:hypothetical protein
MCCPGRTATRKWHPPKRTPAQLSQRADVVLQVLDHVEADRQVEGGVVERHVHDRPFELLASIRTWITNWNDEPNPYIWHKTAEEILDSLAHHFRRINDSGH